MEARQEELSDTNNTLRLPSQDDLEGDRNEIQDEIQIEAVEAAKIENIEELGIEPSIEAIDIEPEDLEAAIARLKEMDIECDKKDITYLGIGDTGKKKVFKLAQSKKYKGSFDSFSSDIGRHPGNDTTFKSAIRIAKTYGVIQIGNRQKAKYFKFN